MPPSITQPRPQARQTTLSTGGTLDERTPPQLLDTTKIATLPVNINIEDPARIEERTGRRALLDTGSEVTIINEKFTDTLRIISHENTLSFWNLNTNTEHIIKSDFTANLTEGVREGTAFYTCNGIFGDKIYKTTLPTLGYNTQTVNFTVGQVITDSVTGATATIIADIDAGATGTLTLDNIDGTFGANIITDPLGGSATSDGAIDYTNTTELANSPKCEHITYFDGSVVAGKTDVDKAEFHVAKQGDPTNWTPGTNKGDSYKESYGRFGEVQSFGTLDNEGIENLGLQLFVGYTDGYIVGHNSITDSGGGTISQSFKYDATRPNAGAFATASTARGLYYSNPDGIFFRQIGQSKSDDDIDDDINVSRNIGNELNDFNFSSSKLTYLPRFKRLLIACRRGSTSNNSVLVHNTETTLAKNKSWWRYEGWRLNSIEVDGETIYGGSSLDGEFYQLFTGNNDGEDTNGNPVKIRTFYEQYLNVFPKDIVGDCYRIGIAGKITKDNPYTIKIDLINEIGQRIIPSNNSFNFDVSTIVAELKGTGTAGMGYTGMGGTTFSDPSAFEKRWFPAYFYNFTSMIITLESLDSQPAQISWFSVETSQIRQQQDGLLTQN